MIMYVKFKKYDSFDILDKVGDAVERVAKELGGAEFDWSNLPLKLQDLTFWQLVRPATQQKLSDILEDKKDALTSEDIAHLSNLLEEDAYKFAYTIESLYSDAFARLEAAVKKEKEKGLTFTFSELAEYYEVARCPIIWEHMSHNHRTKLMAWVEGKIEVDLEEMRSQTLSFRRIRRLIAGIGAGGINSTA